MPRMRYMANFPDDNCLEPEEAPYTVAMYMVESSPVGPGGATNQFVLAPSRDERELREFTDEGLVQEITRRILDADFAERAGEVLAAITREWRE